jgi:GGDEF domain-containing protein
VVGTIQQSPRPTETTDTLTGLASHHVFARAVDQADRDRDRMMVAVVVIEGLAEVNRLCGRHAGDDLIRSTGRPLAERSSVDVTAARLEGGHFGLLWAPADDHRPEHVIDPILDELNRAAGRWAAGLASLGTPSPVVPIPLIGMAVGYDGAVWTEAELALDIVLADPTGPNVARFDPNDGRVAQRRRWQRLVAELARAAEHDRLGLVAGVVEALGPAPTSADDGRWLRVGLHLPNAGRADDHLPANGVSSAELTSTPGLAGELDRRLLDRACDLLSGHADAGRGGGTGRPTRVGVPIFGPLIGRRSVLDDGRAWPPGIVVEIDQARLVALSPSAAAELAQRLTDLGWELTVADFDGGLAGWTAADRLAANHLLVSPELVRGALAGDAAASRLLDVTAASAAATGRLLLAPPAVAGPQELRRRGFDRLLPTLA